MLGTFVFCSVTNPLAGLMEVKRVCRPGGTIILLEHLRSENRLLGPLMDLISPLPRALLGDNINRRTVSLINHAGVKIKEIQDAACLVKLILASPENFSLEKR